MQHLRLAHLRTFVVALVMAALAVTTTVAAVLADGGGAPYPH
jgi:hypothetical protein